MTTTWIVGAVVVACLVVTIAAWRLRKANATMRRIFDEERAETVRRQAEPQQPDESGTPVRRTREIDR